MEVTLPGQDVPVDLRRERCMKAAFKYPVDRRFSQGVAFSLQVLTWLLLETTTGGWVFGRRRPVLPCGIPGAIRRASILHRTTLLAKAPVGEA